MYARTDSAAILVFLGERSGMARYNLANEDGTPFRSHAGGLALGVSHDPLVVPVLGEALDAAAVVGVLPQEPTLPRHNESQNRFQNVVTAQS